MNGLAALAELAEAQSIRQDRMIEICQESSGIEDSIRQSDVTNVLGELTDLAHGADLDGFETVYSFLAGNLEGDGVVLPNPGGILKCLEYLNAVLGEPEDFDSLGQLLKAMQSEHWPHALSDDAALSLSESLLRDLGLDSKRSGGPSSDRPQSLTPEDLRVSILEDVGKEVAEAFRSEAPQHAQTFSNCMQRLHADQDVSAIADAQRVAHTLKGSANITGIPGIANLMHYCEDVLEHFQNAGTMPNTVIMDELVDAADTLESMVEYLNGSGASPGNLESTLHSLLNLANRLDRGEITSEVESGESYQPVDARPSPPAAPAQPSQESLESSIRVPSGLVDNLLRLSGEVSISNVQLQGSHQRLFDLVQYLTSQNALIRQRLSDLQDLVELKGIPTATRQAQGQRGTTFSGKFDPLEMDEYNELHSVTNALAETLIDAEEIAANIARVAGSFDEMLLLQDTISRELNDQVLGARMVPVDSIASRLRRIVRQTARSSGKDVEFTLYGADIELDRVVLNNLVSPLMHLLRNAVDHGIEFSDERIEGGKRESGQLNMSVRREGDSIVIAISDDGRGFDYQRIRSIANERGMIDSATPPDDAELIRFTLLPGFSTREDATQISGRGIGMDVVYRTVLSQRGTIDIVSSEENGTEVVIKVPLTLISMHALLLRVGNQTVGIPSSTILQLIFSDGGRLYAGEHGMLFDFDSATYKVVHLIEMMNAGTGLLEVNGSPLPMLLVQAERDRFAVTVDAALDSRYLIVKNLGKLLPDLPGVIGASILADGGVAPILDVREMLREENWETFHQAALSAATDELAAGSSVLIVDDSLSARRNLAQLFEDAGYIVTTAIDGLDAIERIDENIPDAVLLDMEMPRMNGLELAAHLRASPDTTELPLVMITSRSTQRHRDQANSAGIDLFVTKPYREEDLLSELESLVAVR